MPGRQCRVGRKSREAEKSWWARLARLTRRKKHACPRSISRNSPERVRINIIQPWRSLSYCRRWREREGKSRIAILSACTAQFGTQLACEAWTTFFAVWDLRLVECHEWRRLWGKMKCWSRTHWNVRYICELTYYLTAHAIDWEKMDYSKVEMFEAKVSTFHVLPEIGVLLLISWELRLRFKWKITVTLRINILTLHIDIEKSIDPVCV